ncbi:hypothetical protein GCM10027294_32790 [Marinactinospora endophytica]
MKTLERLWTPKEAAAFLGVSVKTLYDWRYREVGPPSYLVGRHVRYFPDDLRAWVREQC